MKGWNRWRPAPDPKAPPAWPPQIAGAVTLRLLSLVERQRELLDTLERTEDDPCTLDLLYRLDHGNAQVRRLARGLQVLAGEPADYGAGPGTTLLDVVGIATAMVEHYRRVKVGEILELVALSHVADDLGLVLAELLDNATRYGGKATIGTYLLESGDVAFYLQDGGTGCTPEWMARVNAWLAGTVQPVTAQSGQHSGLTVVHHLARKHGLQVNISMTPPEQGEGGTAVTVFVPAQLLAEPQEAEPSAAEPEPVAPSSDLPRRVPGASYTGGDANGHDTSSGDGSLSDLAAAFSAVPDPQE